MRGLFIVMEGPDGSGKTTQIEMLLEYFEKIGQKYIVTREPGGTVIGEKIRQILLDPENKELSDVSEMLLYAASRAQLMKEVIVPALEENKIVICDRFVDSSIVYQGIARNLGVDTVRTINDPGIGENSPDIVFYIDVSEEEGIKRKIKQKKLDRLENESIAFHHMVSEGYRSILTGRKDVVKIDGSLSKEKIQEIIRENIERHNK